MITQRKKFSKELFKKYDMLARAATTEYLTTRGYTVAPHPDKYAQDLVCDDDASQWCVECEVKMVWKSDTFPFDSVQLPERKKKFFNKPTQFFIWNEQLTKAVTFWSHDVSTLTPVEVPNKYIFKGEYFYQIPMDMVRVVSRGKSV